MTLTKKSGFSLIFLAIMLSVLGIALVTAVPTEPDGIRVSYKNTQQKLKAIEKALALYASTNSGDYPCPASRTLATSNTNFGNANDCNPQEPNCTSPFDTGVCENDSLTIETTGTSYSTSTGVMIGAVPTKALNLPDEYAFDEWGRRFTYAIDRGLASSGDGTSSLDIRDSAGGRIIASYALFSHGPNGIGGYNRAGSGGTTTCTAGSANETENCDHNCNSGEANCGNPDFIYQTWSGPGNATTFDDIFSQSGGWETAVLCPGSVPGCVLWLAADDIDGDGTSSGEPANNDDITTWVDKSGNSRNATQANAAKRPQYKTSGINSEPAVYFNRTANDNLGISAAQWSTSGDYTVFIVRSLTTSSAGGTTWHISSNVNYLGAGLSNFYANGIYDLIQNYYGGNLIYSPSYANAYSRSEIITMHYSNSRYGTTYKNGVKIIPTYDRGGAIPASTSNIAASISYDGSAIDGYISEVAAYPTALSDDNRKAVECHLADKYHIVAPHCETASCPAAAGCPAGLTDCKFWYDASDSTYLKEPVTNGDGDLTSYTTPSTNGDSVALWCDKSSTTNHAYYLNTPVLYSVDGLGTGHNAVQTSYTQGIMINEQQSFTDTNNYFTITLVLSPDVGAPRPSGIEGLTAGRLQLPIWGNYHNSYNITGYAEYGGDTFMTDNHSVNYTTTPGTLKSGVPVILTVRQSADPLRTMWLNGAKTSNVTASALPKYHFGDFFGALPGKYAEIIKFNKSLSDAEVDSLHSYLASKWGIAVSNDIGTCPVVTPVTCPESTTGCTYWFDASDTSYVLNSAYTAVSSNDETVKAWCDKSGNNRHAISIGSPKYKTNSFSSGKNSIKTATATGSLLAPAAQIAGSRSFFAVVRTPSSLPSTHSIILTGNNRGRSDHTLLYYPNTLIYNYSDTTSSYYSNNPGTHSIATNTNYILSGKASHGSYNTFYRNGTSFTYANSYMTGTPQLPLLIGGGNDDIGEVIYYNAAQTDATHKILECYLAEKWGLCTSMTPTDGYCNGTASCCTSNPASTNINQDCD
jgi:hypothetical protein